MPTAPRLLRPTDAELEILGVLWEYGPSTVRQAHDKLSLRREVGYTTILKLMQIMTEKGLLLRDESQRSHIYRVSVRETVTQKQLVNDLMSRAFGGSIEKLVMQALSSKRASAQEIADIRKLLDDLECDAK